MREVIKRNLENLFLIDGLETGLFGVERGEKVEEKKPGISSKLLKSKLGQLTFFLVSMLVLVFGYKVLKSVSHQKMLEQLDVKENDFSWVYQIESLDIKKEQIEIKGWAFELKKDLQLKKYELVLQDVNTGKMYSAQMKYTKRDDVNKYFSCEYDYSDSGFVASILSKEIDLQHSVYEVLLRPNEKKYLYATDVFIEFGEIKATSPLLYRHLETEGTDLEQIIKEGSLCAYQAEFGMYIYQNDGNIYWIADENYYFEDDGSTYIQYQLWTTQEKNLPKHRLENHWYFDNIGFYFEDYEIENANTGKYRVAVRELPTEYSIRKIETGYHVDNQWIWRELFYPSYNFESKLGE